MAAADNKKIADEINIKKSQPNKIINDLESKIELLSNKGKYELEMDRSSTIDNNIKDIRNHFESKGYIVTFNNKLYINWD